jgi:hypothetical protein
MEAGDECVSNRARQTRLTGVWRSKSMFRLLDLIASMVRHHPVHSAAIENRVLQTIPSVVS